MRIVFSALLVLCSFFAFSQEPVKEKPKKSLVKTAEERAKALARKAPITSYRIITLERDTTYVDTSLTIKKEYEYNYLRKDIFGLLPFANEGQTYNVLDYGVHTFSPYPEFGYKAKHFNYLEVQDIKYYSVATPITELYFKTVMEQGQNVDALVTLNTSERFNLSVAYKGLRSLGKYINQLTSAGNFRFTSSYNTKNKRYYAKAHFTSQDFLNGENGGITNTENFEGDDADFKQRARLEVYLKDAKSFMRGKRVFLDHSFRINGTAGANNLYVTHQFNYENKFFEFNQATVTSSVRGTALNRFGASYVTSGINDQTKYNRMYNKVGAVYENTSLGKFQFYVDDYKYNYYYNTVFILADQTVPSSLRDEINSFGAQYEYQKKRWNGRFLYSNSITNQSLTNIDANLTFKVNERNKISFEYQNMNKLPDHVYELHQSSYLSYNWFNEFKNEKINNIKVNAETQWADVSVQAAVFNNFLYFSDDNPDQDVQQVSPKQYGGTINYLSVKAHKEIKYWKLGLDNTFLYQKVDQSEFILNVPEFVTRNTLYYSDYYFKRALFMQAGVIFNYFTKYKANDYNPVVGELFVQDIKEIGDYANFDFFVNMRIRQTRIFVKAEHFNSGFGWRNTYYSAPNYPYRDFLIRFGLVWTFFQ